MGKMRKTTMRWSLVVQLKVQTRPEEELLGMAVIKT
jgi:hypothetical protein